MDQQNVFKPTNKVLAKMQLVHLGKILFNLQFIALAIMLTSVLTFILPAIYYLILTFIALLTLFMAFTNPSYTALWSGGDTLMVIADVFTQSWKYTVPIILVLAITSIVCLCFDKNQKHVARIVISAIIAVVAIIFLIAKLINGGAN